MAEQSVRRIYGLETEFGLTCIAGGQRTLSSDEAARYLFKREGNATSSSNAFLANGSRLYLDVGSHPEYATAECDSFIDLLNQDRAGELILQDLVTEAQVSLDHAKVDGDIYLFKNNTDSSGNSYGCHENYLLRRRNDFAGQLESLLPFLITRQLFCGAGKVLKTPRGVQFAFSQRADHMWDGVSSSTTRSRPIINTRDEPHADPELYRRLHVIVGDSNMAEPTTLLKFVSMDLILRVLEAGKLRRDLALENNIRAIRDSSHDITGRAMLTLSDGRSITSLDLAKEYFQIVKNFIEINNHDLSPLHIYGLELWERALTAIESANHSLIDTEIDWAIKEKIINLYAQKHGFGLESSQVAQLDLRYHDIDPMRGIFRLLESSGQARRITSPETVLLAKENPPATTRAKLRGDFIKQAAIRGTGVVVDWTHLKINDATQRTVICKDPFVSVDERVERLIDSL